MDQCNPELTSRKRVSRSDFVSLDPDYATIRGVNAGDNLTEGALACSILSH